MATTPNPTSAATLGGAGNGTIASDAKVTGLKPPRKGQRYWLQVTAEGREDYSDRKPDLPVLTIELVSRRRKAVVERSYTDLLQALDEKAIVVKPRGGGWDFERIDAASAVWLRTRKVAP